MLPLFSTLPLVLFAGPLFYVEIKVFLFRTEQYELDWESGPSGLLHVEPFKLHQRLYRTEHSYLAHVPIVGNDQISYQEMRCGRLPVALRTLATGLSTCNCRNRFLEHLDAWQIENSVCLAPGRTCQLQG
jgi:hypothetical protein